MISQFPNGFCLNVLSVFISFSNLGTTGFFSHAAIACGKHFEVTAFHYKVSAAIQTGFHKGGCNKSWLLRLYLCKLMGTTFCKLCISFAASCNFSAGSMRKPRTYPPLWKKKEQLWYFFLKQNSSDNIPTLKAQQQNSKLRSRDVFFFTYIPLLCCNGLIEEEFLHIESISAKKGWGSSTAMRPLNLDHVSEEFWIHSVKHYKFKVQ